ncbi:MAG: helix-turn-helix transcriptional regulator [Spirochaetales bacterium]|jgi:DNA-binding XRE family transcriptional regulator|nr:helix-turn-helix transcriptional regulator [Spirochaetales bacterium]
MKNLSPKYQTNPHFNQIDQTINWEKKLSFELIQSRKCNLDTFLKMIYMRKIENVFKYSEFSEFKSVYFKLDCERFRILILNIAPSDVAAVLRQIRIQRGYSLEQLARLTGFSKSSISHRESFKTLTFPNLKTIQKYLNSCNLTFFQFIFLIVLKVLTK